MTRQVEGPGDFEVYVANVAVLIRKVQAQLPLVEAQAAGRNPGSLFVAATTRAAIAVQDRADREYRREAIASGIPIGAVGASRAPGNMTGWLLVGEFTMVLRYQLNQFLRHHARPPVVLDQQAQTMGFRPPGAAPEAVFGPVPAREATNRVLVDYLYDLAWTVDHTGLIRSLEADMTYLLGVGSQFLDGDNRNTIGAPCPHCGHRSLVVYKETGVIRCERPRDRVTRQRPSCHCTSTDCVCRSDPAYVHQWYRDANRAATDSWEHLMTQLDHPTKETS